MWGSTEPSFFFCDGFTIPGEYCMVMSRTLKVGEFRQVMKDSVDALIDPLLDFD